MKELKEFAVTVGFILAMGLTFWMPPLSHKLCDLLDDYFLGKD